MTIRAGTALLAILFLSGCATTPQDPIDFGMSDFEPQNANILIAHTEIPEPRLVLPGADCLACLAVAYGMHGSLREHASSLPAEGVDELPQQIAELLRARGATVTLHAENFDPGSYPKLSSDLLNMADRDFSELAETGATHLLVLNFQLIGISRPFSSYVPTGQPQAVFETLSYLVDLETSELKLHQPVRVYRGTAGEWNEPDSGFPELTNSYFEALETGKAQVLGLF